MRFKVQVVIEDDQGKNTIEEVVHFDKMAGKQDLIGLSLSESRNLLKQLQALVVNHQAASYTRSHKNCPLCKKNRQVKDSHQVQYRTLFGIVSLPNLRLIQCPCTSHRT